MQGQAEEYTVYFKPSSNWADANAKFKLNMKKAEGDVWKAVEFSETSISGIYSAQYDTEYDALIQILRFNSDYSQQWNYSAQMTNVPKGDILLYNESSDNNCELKFYCVAASSTDITNGTNTWSGSDVATALIPASDYSTSYNAVLTLTNKLLTAGLTYKFKVVTGDNWYPGNDVEFTVDKDGYYTINYIFNTSDNSVSHSEELTKEVEFRYSVQQYINDNYTQLGEMTMTTDGNAVLTVSQDLTSGTDVLYKVKRAVYADGVDQNKDTWSWYNYGTDGHYTFTPDFSKTYSLTFYYSPVYQSSWASGLALADNYYFVGGNGAWSVNQEAPLTASEGVYSITVSNKAGHTFAIIPDYAFTDATTVSHWEYVIHPQSDANVSVDFANINGLINVANSSNNWEVGSTYADYITFTLDPSTNTWSIAPYFEKELVAEAEGYATFSSKYDVAVPEGLKASYASAVTAGGGAITWTPFDGAIPANQGALLEGTAGKTYKFTPAEATEFTAANYLKANLTQQKLQQTSTIGGTTYTHYVLYKNSTSEIGFYKVNSNGSWIAAGSAYLEVPNAANNEAPAFFAIGGGEGTTGIRAINNGQLTMDNVYYDLSGRRVANPTKGIYIVNGKKVIVK